MFHSCCLISFVGYCLVYDTWYSKEKDISGDQQQYLNGSSSQFFHGSSSQFVHEKQDDEYNGEYTGKKVRFVHKGSFWSSCMVLQLCKNDSTSTVMELHGNFFTVNLVYSGFFLSFGFGVCWLWFILCNFFWMVKT